MPIDDERALFMISVAAELAGVHPQTLRMYERRGLLRPQRTAKNTRRYSPRDVERLQRIQHPLHAGQVKAEFGELLDALQALHVPRRLTARVLGRSLRAQQPAP